MFNFCSSVQSFNSRPHEEVDVLQLSGVRCYSPFNSRPHEEVDWTGLPLPGKTNPFNSRPHEEVDYAGQVPCYGVSLSIHDLTRRSTISPEETGSITVFQFTTSRGGRPNCLFILHLYIDFQFTTSRGGRQQKPGGVRCT